MKLIILFISVALFFLEWFVIRRTSMNKLIPLAGVCAIGAPAAALLGAHLAIFPIMYVLLALIVCAAEDWYYRQKGMTEAEKVKLKDL